MFLPVRDQLLFMAGVGAEEKTVGLKIFHPTIFSKNKISFTPPLRSKKE